MKKYKKKEKKKKKIQYGFKMAKLSIWSPNYFNVTIWFLNL